MNRRPILSYIHVAAFGLAACGEPGASPALQTSEATASNESDLSGYSNARFRVQFANVTAGNVLSPPLLVVHRDEFALFDVGAQASPGVAQVAETGATDVLEAALATEAAVVATAKAEGGPILAGESRSIEIEIARSTLAHGARLSFIAMIGKSNDSFISVPVTLELASIPRRSVRFAATNFDAGSEENTGNVADFGPGGHPTSAAELKVSYDRGLNLRGDAPESIAWGATAAIVSIKRLQ